MTPQDEQKDLPPSLAASIDLFREDPEAWHAEWQRKHDFKVNLITRNKALEAARDHLRAHLQQLKGLCEEIWIAHRNKDDPNYNECEVDQCEWCRETADLLAVLTEPTQEKNDEKTNENAHTRAGESAS